MCDLWDFAGGVYHEAVGTVLVASNVVDGKDLEYIWCKFDKASGTVPDAFKRLRPQKYYM